MGDAFVGLFVYTYYLWTVGTILLYFISQDCFTNSVQCCDSDSFFVPFPLYIYTHTHTHTHPPTHARTHTCTHTHTHTHTHTQVHAHAHRKSFLHLQICNATFHWVLTTRMFLFTSLNFFFNLFHNWHLDCTITKELMTIKKKHTYTPLFHRLVC